jgi:pimeloyl-ACP methyl ester carboxylesterase
MCGYGVGDHLLGVEQAHYFGYSQGGWVDFGLDSYAPERVCSLFAGGEHPCGQSMAHVPGDAERWAGGLPGLSGRSAGRCAARGGESALPKKRPAGAAGGLPERPAGHLGAHLRDDDARSPLPPVVLPPS